MDGPASYILPAITLSFGTLAGTARLVRSSMIEVLSSEYVKLARIKGVSPNIIVWKHCLRNALLPVLTFAGVHLAALLNGSVVVEAIFAWPGVGRLIYEASSGATFLWFRDACSSSASDHHHHLIVDISYSYVDPRIRIGGAK